MTNPSDLREAIEKIIVSGLFGSQTDSLYINNLSYVVKSLEALVAQANREAVEEIKGWIERNHLGKGFDGSDRWEHASAEIVHYIDKELNQLDGEKS